MPQGPFPTNPAIDPDNVRVPLKTNTVGALTVDQLASLTALDTSLGIAGPTGIALLNTAGMVGRVNILAETTNIGHLYDASFTQLGALTTTQVNSLATTQIVALLPAFANATGIQPLGSIELNFPLKAGLVVVPGTGQSVSVSYIAADDDE